MHFTEKEIEARGWLAQAQNPFAAELGCEPLSCCLQSLSFGASSLVPARPGKTQMLLPCTVEGYPSMSCCPLPKVAQIGASLRPRVWSGPGVH